LLPRTDVLRRRQYSGILCYRGLYLVHVSGAMSDVHRNALRVPDETHHLSRSGYDLRRQLYEHQEYVLFEIRHDLRRPGIRFRHWRNCSASEFDLSGHDAEDRIDEDGGRYSPRKADLRYAVL